MNLALRKPMTLPEFLDWEQKQELRYEFDGFQPIAMAGGSAAHAAIQRNLAVSLGGRLRGRPCQFYGSDLKIEVVGRIRYPDGFVVCGPVPLTNTVVHDPIVIFEVLSPSTSGIDRIVKTREYQATTSVRRYVILEQDRIAATVFARRDGDWVGHVLAEDAVLTMPEIDVELPLTELYEGLVLDAVNDAEDEHAPK
ncbi:MAG: Uma2 family endonuclease [Methylocystis silviterrae]|uniref:Uma2 family endonuclease n=1 Tax=Methylocystis silviterrae TaxID=2743612 RepID=UPI003C736071